MSKDNSQHKDNFRQRVLKLDINNKAIKIVLKIDATQPIVVCDEASLNKFQYKEEAGVGTKPNTYTLSDFEEDIQDRLMFITRVTSYINKATVDLYYDTKYKDIIIIPDLTYGKFLPNTQSLIITGRRIGSGEDIGYNMLREMVLSNTESFRIELPKPKTAVTAKVKMVAIPGAQSADFTQDGNSYEEMIDQSINLKRYHRQMSSMIELGTVSQLFGNDVSLPLYLIYQATLRDFHFKYLTNVKVEPDTKLYIPLNF